MTDRELDRSSRRLGKPGWWFLAVAAVIAAPGVVLIVAGSGVADAIGAVLVVLAAVPAVVGAGLVLSGLVAWWAARGKPFA